MIRTYYINATADHTECMNLLAEAGIYVISDLSSPSESIDRSNPSWGIDLYERYTSVIDELAQYNNTIGFFAGNEVSNTVATTDASAYVKAAVRDMKTYIKEKGYRSMGVGYATADVSNIRDHMADYFDCEDDDQTIDFWGYNIYSWCGDSSYADSGYKSRTEEFRNYTVPVFFAEYGCNEVQPRQFTEVSTLYGDTMAEVWSGGIVYMYFQDENDYGGFPLDCTSIGKILILILFQVWCPSWTARASARWPTSPPTPTRSRVPPPRALTRLLTHPPTVHCSPALPWAVTGVPKPPPCLPVPTQPCAAACTMHRPVFPTAACPTRSSEVSSISSADTRTAVD